MTRNEARKTLNETIQMLSDVAKAISDDGAGSDELNIQLDWQVKSIAAQVVSFDANVESII